MNAVKLVSKGLLECNTEELRTFGEYKVGKRIMLDGLRQRVRFYARKWQIMKEMIK